MPFRRISKTLLAVGFPLILALCMVCGIFGVVVYLLTPNHLNPVDAVTLRSYLLRYDTELNTPYGTDISSRRFVVGASDTANDVGINLVTQGFIANGSLFARYMQYEGLDTQLRQGTFFVSPSMTIPQIATVLTDPSPQTVRLTVIEGWRKEQIAAAIDAQPLLDFSGADFLAIVDEGVAIPTEFQTRHSIPTGASLEGFLFPATYEVSITATPLELRQQMLDAFTANVNNQLLADAQAADLTMFEVITLASIVEREAVLPEERPQIADVYLNRLEAGQKLDADPTTQYGIGNTRDGNWWTPLTLEDYQLNHEYNTYVIPALPPGPIASPSLSSIRAVIYPADTPYFYFRADCSGNGAHNFSRTYEEHLAKAC